VRIDERDEGDALALHDRLLALHGGASAVRDLGLLQSALARPQQQLADAESPSPLDMAAAYTAGIAKNHPFVDGNKRTGFVIAVLLVELNGYRFHASEESAAQAVLGLAGGLLDDAGYGPFFGTMLRGVGNRYHVRLLPNESDTRDRLTAIHFVVRYR